MPQSHILRRKRIIVPKRNKQEPSDDGAYFQMMLKFHESILSIVKSIFACLFVFVATPIAILAGGRIANFKQNTFELVYISGEMLLYSLFLFLLYIVFVTSFDLKLRSNTYLAERLKYMNSLMGYLSLLLLAIASARCLYLYSAIIKWI